MNEGVKACRTLATPRDVQIVYRVRCRDGFHCDPRDHIREAPSSSNGASFTEGPQHSEVSLIFDKAVAISEPLKVSPPSVTVKCERGVEASRRFDVLDRDGGGLTSLN